jgi:hypothetical protein
MYLSEISKIVNGFPPHSTDAGIGTDGAYVNVKNYAHVTFIIQQGVGAVGTVTVEKDADGSGAGTAIAFSYRMCNVAYNATTGDTLGDATAAGVGGIATGTTDNSFMVIELDTDVLGAGYPYVRMCVTAVAGVIGGIYILSGARYKETSDTVLTV